MLMQQQTGLQALGHQSTISAHMAFPHARALSHTHTLASTRTRTHLHAHTCTHTHTHTHKHTYTHNMMMTGARAPSQRERSTLRCWLERNRTWSRRTPRRGPSKSAGWRRLCETWRASWVTPRQGMSRSRLGLRCNLQSCRCGEGRGEGALVVCVLWERGAERGAYM